MPRPRPARHPTAPMLAPISLTLTAVACGFAGESSPPKLELNPGDRVAFVGGSFWEEERRGGEIETALTLAVPDVTFRHLGWAGDMADQSARRFFGTPADGREHLLEHVDLVDPTVILVAYGQAEALPGGMSVEAFEKRLDSLLDELEKRSERILLIEPGGGLEEPPKPRMAPYATVVRRVAQQRNHRAEPASSFDRSAFTSPVDAPELHKLIRRKNALFLQRHRPQNETYLRGFRAHEQGNNAVEIEQFEPLVAAKDAEIQALRTQILKDDTE